MTKGERRKQLEIELNKNIGMNATYDQVVKMRKLAAILAG